MKSLARMYVWWPQISQAIEEAVRSCPEFQLNQAIPPTAPLHPWSWPSRPWAQLHLDYAGPVKGKMYLVLIDAHSKWIEVFPTQTATSAAVIDELRAVFAQFGLPEPIVSDNRPCFSSTEFKTFLQNNGVKHLALAPYHPASNGLAERAVQIVKKGLKKVQAGSIQERLAKILMAYRLTPQSTTGVSPAKLLLDKQPRTRLYLLKPNIAECVERQQCKHKGQHNVKVGERVFEVGDEVFVCSHRQGELWLPGVIRQKTGPVSFVVDLADSNGAIRTICVYVLFLLRPPRNRLKELMYM